MNRRGFLSVLFACLASTALSQSIPWPGPGTPAAAGGGGYTGPGDVVAGAAMFAGLRAYTAAIAAGGTQKLINLRRASDNGTCDVLVASNGGLGITANCAGGPSNGTTVSVMCNATTCSMATAYGQVAGNDVTQGSAALQPVFSATGGPSSNPTLTFSASGPLISVPGPTVPAPWTTYFVGQSTVTGQGQWLLPSTSAQVGFNYPGANTAYIYDGVGVSTSAPINTYYAVFGAEDSSGNMSIAVNGAAATTGSGGIHTPWSGTTYWGYTTTGNNQEIAIWPGVLNNAQQNALATNARSNWGF